MNLFEINGLPEGYNRAAIVEKALEALGATVREIKPDSGTELATGIFKVTAPGLVFGAGEIKVALAGYGGFAQVPVEVRPFRPAAGEWGRLGECFPERVHIVRPGDGIVLYAPEGTKQTLAAIVLAPTVPPSQMGYVDVMGPSGTEKRWRPIDQGKEQETP